MNTPLSCRWTDPSYYGRLSGVPATSGHHDRWGLDAFPGLNIGDVNEDMPPNLAALAGELSYMAGSHINAAKTLVLGYSAIPVQALFDQKRHNCEAGPTSLFTTPLVDTSGSKSTLMLKLGKPIRDMEMMLEVESEQHSMEEHTNVLSWESERKGCEAAMKQAWNDPEEMAYLKELHREILAREPEKKLSMRLIYDQGTWPGVFDSMARHAPVAVFCSGEASSFYNGRLLSSMSMFCDMWSGIDQRSDLKSTGSMSVRNPAFGMVLTLQRRPFTRFIMNKGLDAEELGFLSRGLFSYSPKVDRRGLTARNDVKDEAYRWYCAWSKRLLSRFIEKLKAGDLSRHALPMSEKADAQWRATFEWLAESVQPNGRYAPIENYIAKCGENIARIAVIYQIVEDEDSIEVSLENMRRAVSMVKFFVGQYIEIFGEMYFPVVEQDAAQVKEWLNHYHRVTAYFEVSTRVLRQYCWGGREFRHDRGRVDAALEYLEVEGVIVRSNYGARKVVQLNPNYFGITATAVSTLGQGGFPSR